MQEGFLTVSVFDSTTNRPVKNARVNIYSIPDNNQSQQQIYQNLETNISGQITGINLVAPDIKYSQQLSSNVRPYSAYSVEVIADGYEPIIIDGTQIFSTIESRQNVPLIPRARRRFAQKEMRKFFMLVKILYGVIILQKYQRKV